MNHQDSDAIAVRNAQRVVAVVQARLSSVRFPNKVLADLAGKPALLFLLTRLSRARNLDAIVVAIPDTEVNDRLEDEIRHWGYPVIRGSEDDVLSRFVTAAESEKAEIVVRITGDCPIIDPAVVDSVIKKFVATGVDFAKTSEWFPDGFDVEVVSMDLLQQSDVEATEKFDREHVMPWAQRHAHSVTVFDYVRDLAQGRVTLDEAEDLVVLRFVVDFFGRDDFTVDEVVSLMDSRPKFFDANRHLSRNEGAAMGSGEKLWRRAKEVIPGGNMLLSKRAEQFLPIGWPTYFSRAKGCEVWDLDDKKYFDLSLMGVGTNILGYGHPRVDEAVRRAIDKGNMSTLNCPEEVELAERLCELHPWAQMAKFARSGGEACAIAVRIARAASNKPAVAICGYHGWHDWYLSANLADDAALDGHLLPGLTPNGVPRQLQGLTRPFFYNDLETLRQILCDDDVGTIIMEVERSTAPDPGFLEGVRKLADENNCVLIFDECTSGFRRNLGGLHLLYGVNPDIATFGKTIGNGYAITAVIGRREVMESAKSTFVSSTFWTERIGPSAALAALDVMKVEDAPSRIDDIGKQVRFIWAEVLAAESLGHSVTGLPALSVFSIEGWDVARFKQELLKRMLARGFLAGPTVYTSLAHFPDLLTQYRDALSLVIGDITRDSNLVESLSSTSISGTRGFGRLA
jgi:glutamate-1-semialdehyde 2,1-aminomutase